MTLSLRFFPYRDGQNWEASCVDLDIATFAASLDEMKASLATCVEMYLARVAELPAQGQRRFLTRRSPQDLRAKLAFVTWLSGLYGDADCSWGFTFQSHVPMFS